MGQTACSSNACGCSSPANDLTIEDRTKCPGPGLPSDAVPDPTSQCIMSLDKLDMSTEDMYAVAHFNGENGDIRPLLDYTYHKKYSDARVVLQDQILAKFHANAHQQDDLLCPWVIFTAGAMGAGKGFITHWMNENGYLPLHQFVMVDPDEIRQLLPEWNSYVAKDPESAAAKTQKEAGHMAEILGYRALRSRWNVIFDGSLRDVEWYKLYFAKLRHAFPGIRIMILHIQADRETVLRRAEERGRKTGRVVPRSILEASMDAVPKSVAALATYVDVALRVLNMPDKEPQLLREEGSPGPPVGITPTWNYVRQLWRSIDVNGDGELSQAEVSAAMAQGLLTQAVLDTIDTNRDGTISKDEFNRARQQASDSGRCVNGPAIKKESTQKSSKWK